MMGQYSVHVDVQFQMVGKISHGKIWRECHSPTKLQSSQLLRPWHCEVRRLPTGVTVKWTTLNINFSSLHSDWRRVAKLFRNIATYLFHLTVVVQSTTMHSVLWQYVKIHVHALIVAIATEASTHKSVVWFHAGVDWRGRWLVTTFSLSTWRHTYSSLWPAQVNK